MHNQLLCVGHKPPKWVLEGESQYLKRLRPTLKVTLISPSAKSNSDQRKVQEAELIQAKLVKNAWVIALDETGSQYSSRELADKVTAWQRHGRPLAFVIGGADGLDKSFSPSRQCVVLVKTDITARVSPCVFGRGALSSSGAAGGHPYHRD